MRANLFWKIKLEIEFEICDKFDSDSCDICKKKL